MAKEYERSGLLKTRFGESVKEHRKKVSKGEATLSRSPADIQKEVTKTVKESLGLRRYPNTPPPGIKQKANVPSTSVIATNLTGKDQRFFGEEASALTNQALKKYSGMHVSGNQFTSAARNIKYGITGGAMGSGDPTGVMTSIPISSDMQRTQNKMKAAILGLGGYAAGGPTGSILKAVGSKHLSDAYLTSGTAYDDYTKKFKAKQAGKKFTSDRNLFGLLGFDQHKKKTKKDTLGGEIE